MSNDTDTRVVAASMWRNGNTTVATNNSVADIPLNGTVDDTHGITNTTAGTLTIPVSGYYNISARIGIFGGNVLANRYAVVVRDSANNDIVLGEEKFATASSVNGLSLSGLGIYLNAGTILKLSIYGAGNNSVSLLSVSGANERVTRLDVVRVSGPATIAASEKIVALVSSNLTTTSPIGTGVTDIVFDAVEIDTHGIVIPGTPNSIPGSVIATKFKIPRSGYYRFSWQIRTASLTLTTSQRMYSAIAGPTDTKLGLSVIGSSAAIVTSVAYSSNGTLVEHCNSGDEFYIVATSTAATNLNGVDNDNYFCVESV
jgi:hypothetical protein